jgi:glutamate/tyrosine decarboxylase-like PLP-dependent enzyme
LDKLYGSTNAVGVASELILAVLNSNVHVYQVSPALTIIEKTTAHTLANLFGLGGPHAGGISVQGGSASNTTSIVIARNTLYPDTKQEGNSAGGRKLVLSQAHGHYSVEKAAQILGFGSSAVQSVPVDSEGRMIPPELDSLLKKARSEGKTPFYVNATAGTTVLGSYDPFDPIADICKAHNLWLHIDASWEVPLSFLLHKHKLAGTESRQHSDKPAQDDGCTAYMFISLGADMRQFQSKHPTCRLSFPQRGR